MSLLISEIPQPDGGKIFIEDGEVCGGKYGISKRVQKFRLFTHRTPDGDEEKDDWIAYDQKGKGAQIVGSRGNARNQFKKRAKSESSL